MADRNRAGCEREREMKRRYAWEEMHRKLVMAMCGAESHYGLVWVAAP